jgi:hypothetical protein
VINIKMMLWAFVAVSALGTLEAQAQRAVGERTSSGQIVKSTSEVKAVPRKQTGKVVALTPKQVQERQTLARHQQNAITASKLPLSKAVAANTKPSASSKTNVTTIISKDGKVSYGASK